ncbi:glycosyltransferase family 9 protein [Streptomyces himalayensis]|uniref:Glycosyltransferase family 9 protein n=1 Tax=Streptomyces himalayensis subsp. himalayensis TaxID=2756131 RepID=A0A7W0DLM3_9ACTN|nr:glycosyltransferase family 9 protein [Streptomyces himalayensis]MBA2947369.1 glycosyltransferase family 9 protein [Streptomyces himalayensis subsp. himalayensis]
MTHAQVPTAPHPCGDGVPPRLLVLRALGLGDLLTAVPALRALRRAHPGHELVLAAPARTAEAAAATGVVDRLVATTAPGRAVPARIEWAGAPPDVAVDLHGNGPPSHLLLDALRPARLLAYAHPHTPWIPGPSWREDEHERSRWCRLLAWYGIPADADDLRIPAPEVPSPAPGCVVVHPGADSAARRWPAERFAAVARWLHAAGHRVVVTAGAGEGRLGHAVARQAGLPPDAVLGGDDDVPFSRLAALVAHARAIVVGDTGLAHLATALGTPSVVLFGPVSPRLWGPPPSPRHRVLWYPDDTTPGSGNDEVRPGDPHGDRPDERLLRITVDEVLDAVDRLPQPPTTDPRAAARSSASGTCDAQPRIPVAEGRL